MTTSGRSARIEVKKTYKMYIGGRFVRSESERVLPVEGRGGLVNVARGTRKDVKAAVEAARSALPGWAGRSGYLRGQILYRFAEMLEGRADEFVRGLGGGDGAIREVERSVDRLVYFAGWADKYPQLLSSLNPVAHSSLSITAPEEVGVVAATFDSGARLLETVSAAAAILVGGNVALLVAPASSQAVIMTLGEVAHVSDLPAGTLNLLSGAADELLPTLASHEGIDALLVPASARANPELEKAAGSVKRVTSWLSNDERYLERLERVADFQEQKTMWLPGR